MTPKLQDILKLLDEIAPFSIAEEWDNSGFQIGSYSQEIERILTALDPTLKAVRKASDIKAQLLLTHHPLFFGSISSLNIDNYPGDTINEALAKRVSVVAVHTNLDAAEGGINDILADLMDLRDVEPLKGEYEVGDRFTGIGRIGSLPASMKLSTVAETVKDILEAPGIKVLGSGDTEIGRIALVGGSGGSMTDLAWKMGADLLITGDIKHHEAMMAESLGIALIDGGHFRTEKAAFRIFTDILRNKMKECEWDIILENYEEEEEPMMYLC